MIYILVLTMLFGGSSKAVIKDIGKGDIGKINGMCENGSRSHMQMIVNLLKIDKYSIALLEEWSLGRGKIQERVYTIQIDGKKLKVEGNPYFNGMYTYSPVFVAVYKNKIKWQHISTDSCKNFAYSYEGKGMSFYPTTATTHLKPCNIMSLNDETVEISPLFTTSNYHLFLLRAENKDDSVNVVIAKSGELKRNARIKSGEVYIGIMDNGEYDVQVGNIDINLPEALELLEK